MKNPFYITVLSEDVPFVFRLEFLGVNKIDHEFVVFCISIWNLHIGMVFDTVSE